MDKTDNKRAHFPEHETHQMYSGVLTNTNNSNFIHESITDINKRTPFKKDVISEVSTLEEKNVLLLFILWKRGTRKKQKNSWSWRRRRSYGYCSDPVHAQLEALHPLVIGQDVEGTSPGLVIAQAAFRLQSTHTLPLVGKSPAAWLTWLSKKTFPR